MITRNLEVMVSTGVPLVKSFSILAVQSKNKKLKRALIDIKEKIGKGESISGALSKHSDIFSELFQNMIKVGEESGTLEDVLKVLSLQLEKEYGLKSKIKRAMIYPAFILVTMLVIGGAIVIFVLPQLNQLFKSLNVELPIYTKIIMGLGEFSTKYWYFLILALLLLIFIFWIAVKTKKGKWLLDTLLLKLPFFSSFVKKSNSASLIRALSSLISSGVPFIRSLEIASGSVSNFYFKKAVNEASEKIKKGEKFFNALKSYQNIFPFGTLEIIEVGEETGKTSTILKRLAEFYEEEVINATENLSVIIEPILIIILGIVVGFFAVSVIEPIYSTLRTIK
jgi:type IV pilus assembly protein PilC